MGFMVTFITKFVIFIINIERFFKGKSDDDNYDMILETVEKTIENIFGWF